METEQNGAAFAGMSRHHRSRVTNGTKLFAVEGMDGRTGQARRYRDILTQIECDVGASTTFPKASANFAGARPRFLSLRNAWKWMQSPATPSISIFSAS